MHVSVVADYTRSAREDLRICRSGLIVQQGFEREMPIYQPPLKGHSNGGSPMRTARARSERDLAATAASGAATGAPREAAAALEVGAADGATSGEAAGWVVVRMAGSCRASMFVSGKGNTLQPSS